MKPSFALDFRDGVIALLHRTSRGWQQVGVTPVDAADLPEALSYMRSTALGLAPRGLSTKLVIPNEQILYTKVHAPGPDVAKRKRQIKAALEGLTPYSVDDLAYDWWGSGPDVQVAVVAKETLAEAEAFAAEHRFNPVSFVAAPLDGSYGGEPYFGPSALAASLLGEGEKVERDQDPISVVLRDVPRAASNPEPEPEPAPVVEASVPEPAPEVTPTPVAAEPVAEVAAEPTPLAAPEPEPVMARAPEPKKAPEPDVLPDFSAAVAPPVGTAKFDPHAMAVDLVDEAPMAVDVADAAEIQPMVTSPKPSAKPALSVTDPGLMDDLPPPPAPSIQSALASRKSAEVAAPKAKADDAPKAPTLGPAPLQRPSVPRPAMAKPAAPLPGGPREAVPFPTKIQPSKFSIPKPGKSAVTAPGIVGAKRERNVVPLAKPGSDPAAAPVVKPAAKGATGLDGRPVAARGKPRYLGLILTGILLVALALVAFWATYYLASNETDPNAPSTTPAVAEAAAPAAETATAEAAKPAADAATPATDTQAAAAPLPTPEDEALADGQDVVPPDATQTAAAAPEPVAAKPEPAPNTQISTNAAQTNAPGNALQDEIFLASADTPPKTSDPLVMPQAGATTDPPPQMAALPPPYGTVYKFDAEGRIQPTPEGILTPEGVLLIAGKPKLVPPAKPAALAAPAVAATPVPETTAPVLDNTAEGTPVVNDPALAGKKPRTRPLGLVDPVAEAAKQGAALAPDANSRFASLRPQKRPAALTQTAAIAPETQAEAAQPVNEASAASLAVNGLKPSTLAVAVSKKPAARPSGMDQAVDAAVAAAVRAPEPEPEPQQQVAANVAPEAQSEPEVEGPAPSLPTNASVAKQATTKDALNLSRVSLLGIFGTASGRYAMVRQPGGGIKKIKVGDQIDGGRVAAITANAVQYQKGGRMVTLSLPTG